MKLKHISLLIIYITLSLTKLNIPTINQSPSFDEMKNAIMSDNQKKFTTLVKNFDTTLTNQSGENIFNIVITKAKTLLENNQSTDNLIKNFLNPLFLRIEQQAKNETNITDQATIYATIVDLNLNILNSFTQDAFYKTLNNKITEYPIKILKSAAQQSSNKSKLLMQNFAKALHAITQ